MSYLAGLRAEQTFVTANQVTDVNVFTNNYFSIFPSLNIQYELDKKNQLGLNYSRRINRPGTWNTNPFAVITDPFNIYVGNPYLQP